jgi:hypothetical protein
MDDEAAAKRRRPEHHRRLCDGSSFHMEDLPEVKKKCFPPVMGHVVFSI